MRGTFTFKPVKANLTHDTEWITKMDPYCSFSLGNQQFKTQVCKSGGKTPVWNDQIQIPLDSDQQFCYLNLFDKDKLSTDDNIGTATIDLFEVMNTGFVSKWYPIFYQNKAAGEILLEIGFSSSGQNFGNQPFVSGTQNVGYGQNIGTQGYGQSNLGTQGLGTQGLGHNVPLSTGQTFGLHGESSHIHSGPGCCQTGYSQNIPLGTHSSIEDPLYGKTVDVKSVGIHSTGYSGSTFGSNIGSHLGTNVGSHLGSNIDQRTVGQGGTFERMGQKVDQVLGTTGTTGTNQNLNQQQFTQPGSL